MILVGHHVQQHCGNASKHEAKYRAKSNPIRGLISMASFTLMVMDQNRMENVYRNSNGETIHTQTMEKSPKSNHLCGSY